MRDFNSIVAEITETRATLAALEAEVERIEAWEPCEQGEQGEQEKQVAWLEGHGCLKSRGVEHAGWDGWGIEFHCPAGTKEAFTSEFYGDDK